MINVRSKRVNSAENAIKKSILHFLLLDINYPSEAEDCIEQLNKSLELLLRETYKQNGVDTQKIPYKKLINAYWDWDASEKKLIHILREKRNVTIHLGEPEWEGRHAVKSELRELYIIAGQIYNGLSFGLNEIFTPYEANILSGEEIDWKDEAYLLVTASFTYIGDDPEMAIQVSNLGLEKAIRGLAQSWRIQGTDKLDIPDVVQAMYDYEYHLAATIPISYQNDQSKPFFYTHDDHEFSILRTDCLRNVSEVIKTANIIPYRKKEIIKSALEDSRDVVVSFTKIAPDLDYYESVVVNWNKITEIFLQNSPELLFPELDLDAGIQSWWEEDKAIMINFCGTREDVDWGDDQEKQLRLIVETVCGEKPYDLELKIYWEDTIMPRSGIEFFQDE